ncbi:MAG TPA: alkaline phosphatase D family protein [Geminicoccus sp.]|uniref:alkaline phosphatase D family protein n=1 Tax=Geminicoccus sp. TaxID=2024832 RepID=UPI002E3261CB|nr:alkaline phosphatase D family protein [Geminicoccus sp.]HEX2527268.1 alkaline phosphatase D family protein [Geminicoccus sp.]
MDRRALIKAAAAMPLAAGSLSAASAAPRRIAFGSCMNQRQPQPIWDAVLDWRPELFLFTGDNVYGDVSGPECTELREAYRLAREVPGLARLRATVPHAATWDDHDYGGDDAGADAIWRANAQTLFCDYWQLTADDPRWSRPGIYSSRILGAPPFTLQLVLLDTRSFKSRWKPTDKPRARGKEQYLPDDDPGKTVLGAVQWAWLASVLVEPADLRIVVSSMQVLSDAHGFERWGLLPRERSRLLALLDGCTGDVLLLSGDRHFGAIYRRADLSSRPLVEVTSSGINMVYEGVDEVREPDPHRLAPPFAAPNFGTIDVVPGRALLAVRGVDGKVERSLEIVLAR